MEKTAKKNNTVLIMVIYLAGIFMGAIDTGIVTPARTIIQNSMGVDGNTGIWMITIYTLAYAASIPIMGKLADRLGRKYVYIISIILFGTGSLFCGLSHSTGSFEMLLISRVIQAIGGGGIVPVATAEFGTSFPEEKRGTALGLVGAVYGVANVFGASAGSAVLDIVGADNWQFIFYINLPITLFIVIAGLKVLNNNKTENLAKIDAAGTFVLTVMVLSLLYGLKKIDFFSFSQSIMNKDVYLFLLIFVLLVPIFVVIEKKAQDPVLNLKYFTNRNIIITMLLSFASGFVMMGVIFVPDFSQNALKIPSGSGGYLVIALGLFSATGATVSGRLIDKYGAKLVLMFGFIVSIIGAVFLSFVATRYPGYVTVIGGLVLMGLGMGFTIGTPLNYMMLANTDGSEANSALATLSLVRSIGTAIAPAIMVGFISHAGMGVQPKIMEVLPQHMAFPDIPYSQEVTDSINSLKDNPMTAAMFEGVKIPDMSSMDGFNMSEGTDLQMPEELITKLQSSDIMTITENMKLVSQGVFNQMMPGVITKIQSGLDQGISGISMGIQQMQDTKPRMTGDTYEASSMQGTITQLTGLRDKMILLKEAIPDAFSKAEEGYMQGIDDKEDEIQKVFQATLNEGYKNVYMTSTAAAFAAIALLMFYKRPARK